MKKLALLPLAVLVVIVIAGCQDIEKNRSRAEAQMTAPSLSVSGDEAAPTGRSTVCGAYDNELASAQTAGDADRISNLETIIADACN